MGRHLVLLLAFAVLVGACGGLAAEPAPEAAAWDAYCLVFLDTSAPLAIPGMDLPSYQQALARALDPLYQRVFGEDPLPIENPGLGEALERLYAGAGTPDDLWAVEEVGQMLVAVGAQGCADLGQNLTAMPAPPPDTWDVPPETHIDSSYPPGSADEACDVFILTVHSWMDEVYVGAEFGPALADTTDALIAALEDLAVDIGVDQLRVVSEKWGTLRWAQAAEETFPPLTEAASVLAGVAPRCGDLSDVVQYQPEPVAPTTTTGDPGTYWAFDCQSAPPDRRAAESPFSLTLTPSPVIAGNTATLEVGTTGPRPESTVGSWAQWQCWNGTDWVGTHLLEFGFHHGGTVVANDPQVTPTIAGVDVRVPRTFLVTIPNVPSGWYRLRVDGAGGTGYLAVEVTATG